MLSSRMSQSKLKPPRRRRISGSLTPLRPRRDTPRIFRWSLVQARGEESCRWECIDGRWVTIALGHGEQLGKVIVSRSDGPAEVVASYEGALELARSWRD
jgi:hypothetical protein